MKFRILCSWLGLALLPLGARTWTSQDGRSIVADLVSFNGSTVLLKLPNGRQASLPIERFSAEDAAYLRSQAATAATAPDPAAGVDNPDKWPDKVPGPDNFKLREFKTRKSDGGKATYQTRHFKFVCDTPLDDAAREAVGKLYECTWTAIRAMPLPIPRVRRQSYLFDAVLTKDMASYHAAGGPQGSAGVFIAQTAVTGRKVREDDIKEDKTIVPYPGLGFSPDGKLSGDGVKNHVLAHEITHQMTVGLFGDVTWINEGLADYVGSIPYDGQQFDFSGALRNVTTAGKAYSPMNLPYSFANFLDMEQDEFYDRAGGKGHRNYVLATMLVAYFFHLDGKDGIDQFTAYMNVLAKKGKKPTRQLLGKRQMSELEQAFIKAWREQGVEVSFAS